MHPAAARHRLLLTILMVLVQVALLPAQAHWRCMLRTGTTDCCCAAHGGEHENAPAANDGCCSQRHAQDAPPQDDEGGDDDCCCGDDDPLHFAPVDSDDSSAAHEVPPLPTPALPPAPVTFCATAPRHQRAVARVRLARPPTGPPLYLRYRVFLH